MELFQGLATFLILKLLYEMVVWVAVGISYIIDFVKIVVFFVKEFKINFNFHLKRTV